MINFTKENFKNLPFEKLLNSIICGSSEKVLSYFPDNLIDLVISSPPYDQIRSYKNTEWNFGIFKKTAKELFRIMKKGGIIIWVVGDQVIDSSESGSSFKQALYFKEIDFNIHDTMIYKKNGSSFPAKRDGNRYTQIFEYVFIFSKGIPKTCNLICDKPNKWVHSFGNSGARYKDEIKKRDKKVGYSLFSPRNNIWEFVTGKDYSTKDDIAYEQPAIFPEGLVHDHIITWSNEDDIVLDPFLGSGTTAKIAKILNRKFIGIDIVERYCKIAEERLKINTFVKQNQPGFLGRRVSAKSKGRNQKFLEMFDV